MSSALPLILITGATGFVGTHVLEQAVEAGYPVRITTRPSKVDALLEKYNGKIQVVAISDLATGDYTEALKGVGAVIHVAASLPGKVDAAGLIEAAAEGGLNLLRQAEKNGVKKVVITSSLVTAFDAADADINFSDKVYSPENDWNPATKEVALSGSHHPFWSYCAAKTIAEQEVWKFTESHPGMDVTTINPPYIYGPLAKGVHISQAELKSYSTLPYFYGNVFAGSSVKFPAERQSTAPTTIDVRDVAKAHILALRSPPTSVVGRKRLFISGPPLTWKNAVEHLVATKPELKDRLPDVSQQLVTKVASVDDTKAKEVLGFKEYIDWRKTVEDTAESMLAVEKASE